jgi:hypothetical protein
MATQDPSEHARDLVRGSYDLHVHLEPDVMKRRIDDLGVARRSLEVGLAGFVLKSHYVPTGERASVVRKAVPGVDVRGGITLNNSVGGMNPTAVEIAARSGTSIVWFPTVDSANQRSSQSRDPEGARPPMWAALQQELRERGISADPVPILTDDGSVTEDVRQVLTLIAEHNLTLATGHLSTAEIMAVVAAATEARVQRIIVTHPEFTSQRVPPDLQRELASRGAYLERCFTTPHSGKVTWDEMFANVRAAGPESSVLATDLGQPFNPPVEDGLALMAEKFLAAGFTEKEVSVMTVRNSRWLIGAQA